MVMKDEQEGPRADSTLDSPFGRQTQLLVFPKGQGSLPACASLRGLSAEMSAPPSARASPRELVLAVWPRSLGWDFGARVFGVQVGRDGDRDHRR